MFKDHRTQLSLHQHTARRQREAARLERLAGERRAADRAAARRAADRRGRRSVRRLIGRSIVTVGTRIAGDPAHHQARSR